MTFQPHRKKNVRKHYIQYKHNIKRSFELLYSQLYLHTNMKTTSITIQIKEVLQ